MKTLERFIGCHVGRVSRLGWFGFAADPPTLAHRAVVDAALGSGLMDKLVVFPSGDLPYKHLQASPWERAEMVELWKASADFGEEVLLSLFDLQRERAILWYDLWKQLQSLAPQIQHHFVLGSKDYGEIAQKWNKGEQLLASASFLVVPRAGFPVKSAKPADIILPIDPLLGSSTDVRAGDLSLVDERVAQYIQDHHLYSHAPSGRSDRASG